MTNTITQSADGKYYYYYKGSLYLDGTKIKSLPDNLVVGGDLDLSHSKIKTLPDNLVVGGKLYF